MRSGIGRAFAATALAAPILVVPLAQEAAAAAELTAAKQAPASVLAGEPVPYTLTASNPGDEPIFNLTFRDVLPVGASYVGPTEPPEAGEPQTITNLVEFPAGSGELVPQQTLIWSNVADLQADDSFEISFGVAFNGSPDPTYPTLPVFSVGSTVANAGEVYASEDARVLPRFDATGVPEADARVRSDLAQSGATRLTAIEVEKDEPSPEGELLRGVHRFPTTYSLRVRVSPQAGVDGVQLTDHLPAALEFLACGGIDNTPDGAVEYPGAPRLTVVPLLLTGCPTPASVDTVVDPAPAGGTVYPPGTYTAVAWDLGDLPAGADLTIRYSAGVPLRENERFPDPSLVPPLGQAANLANNTGPSTRELAGERSVVNIARVSGTYLGALAPGATADVADDDRLTRSVEDVRILKSVEPREFTQGGKARYTVRVDVSQYVSAADVVLTDRVPNGVCPLAPGQNFSGDGASECDGAGGDQATVSVTGGPTDVDVAFTSVTPDTTQGGYEVVFEPLPPVPAGGSATVEYVGGMRPDYENGRNDGQATVAGDTFVNVVTSSATTTPIPPSPEACPEEPCAPGTGDQTVGDESFATQVTSGLTIDKELLPRTRLNPGDPCPDTGYEEVTQPTDPRFRYRLGDRVCFKLRVDFPARTSTREATIADFLPVGVEYEAGSMRATPSAALAPFVFNEDQASAGLQPPVWLVGTESGGVRFTEPGAVFEVVLAGRVVDIPDTGSPQVTGNLMKMRTLSTEGAASSYRDQVPFSIAPAPEVQIRKGVDAVDDPPFTAPGPDTDGVAVAEDSVVRFRIDVTNAGTLDSGNDFSVRGLDIWDVLPPGITCTEVSNISSFVDDTDADPVTGSCTGPGDPNHPPFTLADSRWAVRWVFPTDAADPDRWAVFPGQPRTLTYDVTIPTPTSAGTRLENTASIRSFEAFTSDEATAATYFPADNVDTTVTPDQENAPPASDRSFVFTPGTLVTKTAVTSVVEPTGPPPQNRPGNNNLTTEAVPGETITYTYGVDIPPRTSVFGAVLRDGITSNANRLSLVSSDWEFVPDASAPETTGPDPAGFSLTPDGVLTFPPVYTNGTGATQRFRVLLTFRVRNDFGQNALTVANTASFTSFEDAGGRPVETPDASWAVTLRQPNPSLTKTASPTTVTGGETARFTLTARNTAGRPPVHDVLVEDCIPAELTFAGFAAVYPGIVGPEPGSAANGCDPTETYVAFRIGTIYGGETVTRAYDVTVTTEAVGGDRYRNDAELTGGSLDEQRDVDNPFERTYSRPASAEVVVPGAGVAKSVSPTRASIGQTVTYTARATIPEDTNFYQAALLDTVPPGIDPDSIELVGVECAAETIPPSPCALTASPLPVVADPGVPGGHLVAFLVGDVPAAPVPRAVTLVYDAVVADVPANLAGTGLVNAVRTVWNTEPGGEVPSDPTYRWSNTGETATATVTVLEPDLTTSKGVSDTTPEPGQRFTYTVTVANAGTGPAFDLVVVDEVPVGVVVDETSISNGGTYDPASRLVTWDASDLPGPLDAGGALELTYVAVLAPSADIERGVALTNVVTVASHESWPTGGRPYGPGTPAEATVTPALPRLSVVKLAVDGEPTYLDTDYTWEIEITNVGDGRAFGVAAVDVLPPGWRYVPDSARLTFPDGSTVAREPIGTLPLPAPQELRWADLGELGPGEAVAISFQARATDLVLDPPGIGSSVAQVNTVRASAFDRTGASASRAPDGSPDPYGDDAAASTRIDAVDLAIEKRPAAGAPVAGESYTWTVQVRNESATDTAVGRFVLTETLPATPGVTFVAAAGTGWSCAPPSGGAVTCSRTSSAETLGPQASFPPLLVTVDLDPDIEAGTPITNQVSVAGRTYDVDVSNNEASSTVEVTTEADLEVVKSHAGPVVAGRPLTYTLAVANNGPSTSRRPVTVTDTLPDGVSFTSWSAPAPWQCSHDGAASGGTLTCTAGADLPVGSTALVAVEVLVLSGTTTAQVNTAEIAGTTPDPNLANNSSADTVTPVTSADLFVTKDATTPLLAGSTGTYRLRAGNNGPSDAVAVRITDALPSGLTFAGFTSVTGTWSCDADGAGNVSFTCRLADPLVSGGEATVDVQVAVAPDLAGVIVNEAVVAADTFDPIPVNNRDTDATDVDTEADLTVTKESSGPVVAGERVTWTIVVENLGPSDSPGPIVVQDDLPGSVEFVSATGWGCTHDGAPVGGLVTCTLAGPLPAGGLAPPIVLTARVLPGAGPGTIVNLAVVDGPIDPNPDNDDASSPVTVTDEADLGLVKSVRPTAVLAGREVTYTLEVTNRGPSDADGAILTDQLPPGMTAQSATSSTWTCPPPSASRVICSRASIAAGDVSTVTVVALVDSSVPDGTVLTNAAEVTSATTERDPTDNEASVELPVSAQADLYLLKTHPDGSVTAGDDVVFTLTAGNRGPSDAVADVVIEDRLPPGFTYAGAGGPWTCQEGPVEATGQVVTCTLDDGPLPAGATAQLQMTVTTDPAAEPGPYLNTATVTSPTGDAGNDDNTATDEVTLVAAADLSIAKVHDPGTVRVGDDLEFTLTVRNDGPSLARDVVVVDLLPGGLTARSATGNGWTCTIVGPEVTCRLATSLPPATSAAGIAVVATVEAAAYPQVLNTASVTSSTDDPDLTDNSTEDRVTVPPLVDLAVAKSHAGPVAVGGSITYTLTVTNLGPTPDPGPVTVTDPLPPSLRPRSAAGAGAACSVTGQAVQCSLAGPLAVGEQRVLTVVADVLPAAAPSVTNTVTVSTPSEQTDRSNDRATDTASVTPDIRLQVDKTRSALSGLTVTWQIGVTNVGANATTEPVVMADELPDGLRFVSVTGEGWACTGTQVVTCTYGQQLGAGAVAPPITLVTTITAPAGTVIVNTATVTGGSPDATPVSDSDQVVVSILPPTGGSLDPVPVAIAMVLLGAGILVTARRRDRAGRVG